jgi:MYXO-CTERM domain-containing protein
MQSHRVARWGGRRFPPQTPFLWLLTLALLAPALTLTPQPIQASGFEHLPGEFRELRREVRGDRADVWLELPAEFFGPRGLDELHLEALHRRYLSAIGRESSPGPAQAELSLPQPLPEQVRHVELWGQLPRRIKGLAARPGKWLPLPQLMADPPQVPRRSWEKPLPAAPVASTLDGDTPPGLSKGALSGKTVYLSPGHGLTWNLNVNRWATQRGNTHNLVEDFLNAEAALHYLVPMLRNSGAKVVTLRELDLQSAEVMVDDATPQGSDGSGYKELAGPWQQGASPGFAPQAVINGSDNPFVMGSYRASAASNAAITASAQYLPKVPATGRYAVYVTWVVGANRLPDAHYEIRHLGGSTHIRVDQTKHGGTWTWLGYFNFAAGIDPTKGAILLHNDTLSGLKDRYVIADGVRLGGGLGSVARGTGKPPAAGPTSGRPRWEESCRTYAQFQGAPASVYDSSSDDPSDDVTCRSRFSAWHHEEGEDAIFLSWHTNAPSPARGTSTYVYGPNAPDGTYNFSGTQGSEAFGKLVQKLMVADIKALWDPAWKDRGVYTAYFGEINPKHNPEMPAVLVEAAFHSTLEDADALREPRFRHLLARSLYKAIAQYFAERDKIALLVQPEPPQAVRMARTAPGQATVQWQPGPVGGAYGQAPTSYLLQLSKDGLGFDEGIAVVGTSQAVTLPAGSAPLFARVVALNPGGVSLPSAVVGAVEGCAGAKRALVVQGFTRLDSALAPVEDLSIFGLGQIQQLRQQKMNTYGYLVAHIGDLAAAGLGVDSTERLALDAAQLSGHALVDWAAGENSTADGVLDAGQKSLLTDWLQAQPGRSLWLNGAETTWALEFKAGAAGGDWLETWFGARYLGDDAGVYGLEGAAGLGGAWKFDDGTGPSYHVDFPDVLTPKTASVLLNYAGAKGVAATLQQLPNKSNALLCGVPLETIHPAAARTSLVAKLVQASLSQQACAVDPGGTDGGSADTTGSDGGSVDAISADTAAGGDDTGAQSDLGADAAAVDTAGADAAGNDANLSELTGSDAVAPDLGPGGDAAVDASADVAAKPLPLAPAPVDDGCSAAASPGSPSAWLILAMAGLWLRRRKPA